jgi:drug/metabolite transporter (DMT)-like permease
MPDLLGSAALFTSNILVCIALVLLRHSADDAMTRTFYLLAANGVAGLLGFLPFRKENALRLDAPTLAVVVWSACYCAEYGLFLVYPGIISLSQLIVCNSLAPFIAVYLSRDVLRARVNGAHRLLSVLPVLFLIGISYLERNATSRSGVFLWLILLLVFASIIVSQSCARYVARNRSPTWSQPRLTLLNAALLSVVLELRLSHSGTALRPSIRISTCLGVGIMILAIQRLYVFGLRKADPFISAMTLCTIVPLSLGIEFVVEHRQVHLAEAAFAAGYILSNAISVKMSS